MPDSIQQDVIHDNFVPRYSALADAATKPVVLVGVWLIFAPALLAAALYAVLSLLEATGPVEAILRMIVSAAAMVLSGAILWKTTVRYRKRRSGARQR